MKSLNDIPHKLRKKHFRQFSAKHIQTYCRSSVTAPPARLEGWLGPPGCPDARPQEFGENLRIEESVTNKDGISIDGNIDCNIMGF